MNTVLSLALIKIQNVKHIDLVKLEKERMTKNVNFFKAHLFIQKNKINQKCNHQKKHQREK